MIGVFDYTVILTYLSLLSAGTGIVVSLSGNGHPYWGVFFLLLCGLFDAFDGKVARTKRNRTKMECDFGIQIDSLSDLVAFGVLPVCVGVALLRSSFLQRHPFGESPWNAILFGVLIAVLLLYLLAALIRLAYYNVTEEERQRTEGGARKYFVGLPVTSSALIFPTVMLFHYILKADIFSLIYVGIALITGVAFVSKIQVQKPGTRGVMVMVVIGFAEFAALVVFMILRQKNLL